jgi:hypothetical protein
MRPKDAVGDAVSGFSARADSGRLAAGQRDGVSVNDTVGDAVSGRTALTASSGGVIYPPDAGGAVGQGRDDATGPDSPKDAA